MKKLKTVQTGSGICKACGRLVSACGGCKPAPRIGVKNKVAWARMRKLLRVSRAAAEAMLRLQQQGLSPSDARRVLELWFERCERLGPYLTYRAAHRLDHWAQTVLAELEFKEDAIMRRYLEKRKPTIKRKRRTQS